MPKCAVIPIWPIIASRLSLSLYDSELFTVPSRVAVQNSYKHFCLPHELVSKLVCLEPLLCCIVYPWLCIHSCFQSPLSLLKHRSRFWDSLTSRTTQSRSSFVAHRSHCLLWFYNSRYTFQTTKECNILCNVSSGRLSGDSRHRVAGQLMNPLHAFCSFVTPVEWKQMG